jgi:hypothetical protein
MDRKCSNLVLRLLLVLTVFVVGCNAPRSQLAEFDNSFKRDYTGTSDLGATTEYARSKISRSEKPKGEDLLWSMQLGSLERIEQNHQQSNHYFDKSEEMLNFFDYRSGAADSVAATAVSDNVIPYVGEEYDGIMVNTYKALNFMTLGENELARVEFNRALDRQRRAKEKFAREIAKLKDELEQAEKKQKKGKSHVKKSVDNPEVEKLISSRYPSLYEFEAYPDFVNPFTTYVAAVYFNLVGDHSKAATLLKESYGMVSGNDHIAEDVVVTERVLDGQGELRDTVWVIFENGMGPIKEEFRIDIPLFVATNKVKYVGIALPKLKFRQEAYPYLSIVAGGQNCRTQPIANMDRVVQTEFNKDFKGILTRAIISATAKAIAQYALEEEGSSLLSLAAALYSLATTAADVRIWTTLPKDFQVARLPMPADRVLTVEPPGAAPFRVEIPTCRNAVVYVKIPFNQARVVCDLITY